MKYLVFPKLYDPVIAAGPPSKEYTDAGITWTEEETNAHRKLRKLAVLKDSFPTSQYFIRFAETKEELEELKRDGHTNPVIGGYVKYLEEFRK